MAHEDESSEKLSLDNYYSLLELLEKLGKEGVAELVTKGKLRRITQGDMIYFLKVDVNRILGEDVLEGSGSVGVIVDDQIDTSQPLVSQLVFKQTLLKRHKIEKEEEVYSDKVLDLTKEVLYGRSHGDPQEKQAFTECGIISSTHGKLYLDEEKNLLYENLGANKSKIRGCNDKDYAVLEQNEAAVLIPREKLEELLVRPHSLTVSIKLGYQVKPHFVVRIRVAKR
jgi:hypothetical protein